MDPIKFKKFISFSDQVKTLSKINGTGDCGFLIIKKNNNEVIFRKDALSFMDLNVIKYLVVFCTKNWKSSGYTNSSYMLLGMFNGNFEQVNEIPCSKGAIVDVKFTKYPSSYYNEYKPILVVEDNNGNLTEKVREEKGNGTADDLSALFSQALAKA